MNLEATLAEELDRWSAAGLTPRLWLRDDDAVAPTPALDRLLDMVKRHDAPVLLAVIPKEATEALAERLEAEPLVTPCLHGWAHARHTPADRKAVELGGDRRVDDVLDELRRGHARLRTLFARRMSGILVPPWNRMDAGVAAQVHQCGFTAVSTFGWQRTGTELPELNTHVDIIDWHGSRGGREASWAFVECTRLLVEARELGGAPVGILTHHLVHDEQAWRTLDALLAALRSRGCRLHRADQLIA